MLEKSYRRIIIILILVFLLTLSTLIILPYIDAILTAIILSILFYPIFKWLSKKIKKRVLAALIVVLMVLMIALVPTVMLLNSLIGQVNAAATYVRQEFSDNGVYDFTCAGKSNLLCDTYAQINQRFPEFDLKKTIDNNSKELTARVTDSLRSLTTGILTFIISLFILFYLLIDGPRLLRFMRHTLALKPEYEAHLDKTMRETVYGVVFGSLVIAFVQGAIAALGYWLIGGIGGPVLLGLLTAFFALIPSVGTALVWFPLSVYLFISGLTSHTNSQIIRGILLFAYGLLIISTIDNVLKPKIIGDRAKIHPAVVLIGVLGGLKFMGFIGVMVGPLVLALAISSLQLLRLDIKNI